MHSLALPFCGDCVAPGVPPGPGAALLLLSLLLLLLSLLLLFLFVFVLQLLLLLLVGAVQGNTLLNSSAAYVEVDSLKFTDELLPSAVLAYAALGLSDKDMFSSTKITRATDAKFDDEGWAMQHPPSLAPPLPRVPAPVFGSGGPCVLRVPSVCVLRVPSVCVLRVPSVCVLRVPSVCVLRVPSVCVPRVPSLCVLLCHGWWY